MNVIDVKNLIINLLLNYMTNRDDQLKSIGKSIVNVLLNGGIKVTKAAVSGSVAKQNTHSKSDVDVIYVIQGNPSNKEMDPKVVKLLRDNYSSYNARQSENKVVVKLDIPNFGHADIKLKTQNGFDHEMRANKDYRRLNL